MTLGENQIMGFPSIFADILGGIILEHLAWNLNENTYVNGHTRVTVECVVFHSSNPRGVNSSILKLCNIFLITW